MKQRWMRIAATSDVLLMNCVSNQRSQHEWVFRELLQSCVIPSTSFCSPIDPPPAFVLLTIPRSPAARAAAVPPSHGAVIVL